ncbi:metalloregulator ArsR/SmtB family transcription factor [Anaerolinea thermophila]|uniref:ArsR family transcriptional regulator n=1 Tax=Anaerolinea thermophila (strain DSM 14523 / JCM 11388 / NBRC 100420 / UNI-1) TaxID=926569 RepID=E8N5B8_ANATU|nr:metalloregulator ArsR/SmtB family transcription factor [Anaerolinea thermophila]BAJ63632.1 ArsR family transcriptional regulator [Anaerolinea thermophila UNI-1]
MNAEIQNPSSSTVNELLAFFKALSDANRLRILGVLANQSMSVEQISTSLNLSPSTVSHHLAKLSEAGLVTAKPESYYNIYSLNSATLEEMSQRLLRKENLVQLAEEIDLESFDRKVIRDYMTPTGKLKTIPAQEKKLLAILRYLAQSFETGKSYSEREVNEILKKFHDDFASLRRYLIDYGFMQRENGVYQRIR